MNKSPLADQRLALRPTSDCLWAGASSQPKPNLVTDEDGSSVGQQDVSEMLLFPGVASMASIFIGLGQQLVVLMVDFGLVSVVLDSVVQATAMMGEHSRRKKQQARDDAAAVIQRLDVDAITQAISPLRLATFMRGGVTAAGIKPVIESRRFRGLVKELFLATVTDHNVQGLKLIDDSIALIFNEELRASASEIDINCFCSDLISALHRVCEEIVDGMREVSPEALSNLQQTGLLKRLTHVIENIDKNFSALSTQGQSDEIRKSWLSMYRLACHRVHGYISPPDFETNRKIPMSELYVVPKITVGGSKAYREGSELDFESFRAAIDRTVLLGDPGGGKSTLSNFLTADWAASEEGIVPFHVTLREYASDNSERSIVQFIEQQLSSRYQHPSPPGLVEALLLSGEAAVVFDGLDELIDTTKRRVVSNAVELFSVIYPLSKILVTSRRVGYDQAKLDSDIFEVRVIGGFNGDEVAEYVQKWFASQEEYQDDESRRLSDSFIHQSAAVPDLRSNPLMLALMCIIFRGDSFIPRNRPDVYEKCATLLFEKWDGHRDIQVPLEAREHVDSAMKYVAHWMLRTENDKGGVPYNRLVREMATYLRERAFETVEEAERASAEFVDFCKGRAWVFSDAGTTADGTPLFTFTHRTFMEYFAAYHLTRINDTPEKLARMLLPRVAREEWDVVAQLAIQIVEKSADLGSERALTAMLHEKRKRSDVGRYNVLVFIAKCSEFATVSPSFIRRLATACIEVLLSTTGEEFLEESFRVMPWWTLLRSAAESHKSHQDPIAEEHKRLIAERLKLSDDPEGWHSVRHAIFVGQSFCWPWFVRNDGPLAVWAPLFRDLATGSPEIATACLKDGSTYTDSVVAGVVSPSTAVRSLKSKGLGFSSIYFGFRGDGEAFWRVPSFAHVVMLVSAYYDDSRQSPELEFVHELSALFLADFWAGVRGPVIDANAFLDDDRAAARFNTFGHFGTNGPGELREAAFLAQLGQIETLDEDPFTVQSSLLLEDSLAGRMAALRKTRMLGSFEVDELVELGLPSRTVDFAQRWLERKVSVFDRPGR